ncbi:MAG TPA: DUF3500 domain-containing protein [Jatrophihabitans sp.]|nr:DUF3500 domain-containing protein [Jatrophihabitans sp.]
MAAHPITSSMRGTANRLLLSCDAEQRRDLHHSLTSESLNRWTYLPHPRPGLLLGQMTKAQRLLVHELLGLILSEACHAQIAMIMAMEDVLNRREGYCRGRHSTDFWFLLFGNPDQDEIVSWRLEGHHVCVQANIDGVELTVDPLFLGCHPALISQGGRVVAEPLAREEQLARELIGSLEPAQRGRVLTTPDAPPDIYTGNRGPLRAHELRSLRTGIPVAEFEPPGRQHLDTLLDLYAGRLVDALADPLRADLADDALKFCWEGGLHRSEPHYYRLTGNRYVIEHENATHQANHIHNVVRRRRPEPGGADVLSQHLAAESADG